MLELKTKQALAKDAFMLAQGSHLVRYRNVTYIPADFETRETDVPPDIDRTIWLPLSRRQIQGLAASQFDTLFASDGELASFDFMVAQTANQIEKPVNSLLVRTQSGLKELNERGELVDTTGEFRPNTLTPMLNEDPVTKAVVLDLFAEWLNSKEEAESLLSHLATSLAPGYSAVKYVLLIGDGRNGKSLMLKMLQGLFGMENISNVTRQAMSEQSAVVTDLNGKLLNIIFDGAAEYVKNSGPEKSLIAGEPIPIRRLYESSATMVQTNALFIEGLNKEPKTSDKSTALQKRIVRYLFPNVYPLSHSYERTMLSEKMVGAFLSLLIDRYVHENEVAYRLAPTAKGMELQLESMFTNSIGMQFIKWLEEHDAIGATGLLGLTLPELSTQFRSWRLKENDVGTWSEPDVLGLFQPLVNTERKTQRINGAPRKVRVVTSFKDEAAAFIESLEGNDNDAAILAAVVEE